MARTKVQSELIATNAISGTIIADGAITSTHLAANCVDSSELVTGSIDTIHIAANQVTATKIVTNGVLTRHISDDQVTAAKLANSINTDIATGVTANTTANAALPKAGGTMTGALVVTGDANPALEVSRGSANTTNVNLKYNTTLTGQLSAANEKFQISAAGSGTEMEFYTNGTKALEIDTSGNVGIGMDPNGYGKLSVNGTGVILALRASSGAGRLGFYEAGAGRFYLDTLNGSDGLKFVDGDGTTERMRIDASGHVGIGMTAAPIGSDTVLALYNSGTPRIKLHNSTTGTASGDGGEINMSGNIMILENRENAEMRFYTNGAERLQISNNGNLEFKSTTSSFTGASSFTNHTNGYLYLRGGTSGLRLDDDSSVNTIQIVDGSSGYIKFETGDGTERMRIDSSGKVGIGTGTTAPNAPLEINGGTAMTGGWGRSLLLRHNFPVMVFQSEYSTDAYGAIGYDNSTGMHFMVNSSSVDPFSSSQSPALFIQDDKNIGIGTTSPNIGRLQIHGGGGSGVATLHLQSDTSTQFNHSINAFNSNLTDGENNLVVIGKEGSTKNSAWIGYKWRSAGSDSNQLTFGHWGNNNILNLLGNGYFGIGTETPGANLHVYGANYSVKIESSTGYANMGSNNTSYFHFAGNRTFYFDNRCEASGGFHTYSDERLKENIVIMTGALDSVAKMNGVTFKWKDAAKRGGGDTGKQFGVTAQNMATIDSELPTLNVDPLETQENIDDDSKDTDYYSMDYSRITPFLIEAIKELKTKLEEAEARIATLEG